MPKLQNDMKAELPRRRHRQRLLLRVPLIAVPIFILISLYHTVWGELLVLQEFWEAKRLESSEQQQRILIADSSDRLWFNVSNAKTVVEFIPPEDLTGNDIFAASWWQMTERFLLLNVDTVENVESDAFKPIKTVGKGVADARMTTDWLDFSVEHLSKWWKLIGHVGQDHVCDQLYKYVQRALPSKHLQDSSSSSMNSTLALIPYGVNGNEKVWEAALTATVASLMRQGIGRIVVVGHYEADARLTRAAFSFIRSLYGDRHSSTSTVPGVSRHSFSCTVEGTELTFVHTDQVQSRFVTTNVPKGALQGLHDAMSGLLKENTTDWLGDGPSTMKTNRWKYIYFTEADQILNARLSSPLFAEMDKGGIVIPHRLQPIPHWMDLLQHFSKEEEIPMIPRNVPTFVHELGRDGSCCDLGSQRPPRTCGTFWWMCGFGKTETFDHLIANYTFMRVGTGIVHLAATEHGRRCSPKQRMGQCSELLGKAERPPKSTRRRHV